MQATGDVIDAGAMRAGELSSPILESFWVKIIYGLYQGLFGENGSYHLGFRVKVSGLRDLGFKGLRGGFRVWGV